jgi:hypothetical protein
VLADSGEEVRQFRTRDAVGETPAYAKASADRPAAAKALSGKPTTAVDPPSLKLWRTRTTALPKKSGIGLD